MAMLAAFLTLVAVGASIGGIVKEEPITPQLTWIAEADGKYFHADHSAARTWKAAGEFCQSKGMDLASITSKNQSDALDRAYQFPDFDGEFWTAGRDARQHRQFSWNDTDEEISAEFLNTVYTSPFDYLTCILYHSTYNSDAGIHFWPCSSENFVLCETYAKV